MIPWNKGKTGVYSDLQLQLISERTKIAMSSPEVRAKLRVLKGNSNGFKKGHPNFLSPANYYKLSHTPWNKGIPISDRTRAKLRDASLGKRMGQDNPFWRGGVSSMKGYAGQCQKKRRARLRGASGSHTILDWEALKKLYDFRCLDCNKREPEIKLTEDHIVPISKGGSDYISNIQPLCHSCNSKKYTKTIKFIK